MKIITKLAQLQGVRETLRRERPQRRQISQAIRAALIGSSGGYAQSRSSPGALGYTRYRRIVFGTSCLYVALTACGPPGKPDVRGASRDHEQILDSARVVRIAEEVYRKESAIKDIEVLEFTRAAGAWVVILAPSDVNSVGGDLTIRVEQDGSARVVHRGQ